MIRRTGPRGQPIRRTLVVAIPPIAYVGWRGAVAHVIGANMWAIGAVFLIAILAPTCTAAAALGWFTPHAHPAPNLGRELSVRPRGVPAACPMVR
jgi:hypothetical protein